MYLARIHATIPHYLYEMVWFELLEEDCRLLGHAGLSLIKGLPVYVLDWILSV